MSANLRLALAQCNLLVGDVPANSDRVIRLSLEARDRLRADVVVFPELTLTGYPPEDLLLRPAFQRLVDESLARIMRDVTGIFIVVGHPEIEGEARYNSASLIRDGEVVARCRKHHLPNYSVFDEARYFTPGDGYALADIKGYKVALSICEDIWRPRSARLAADAGAQLMININASPFHLGKGREREQVVAQRVAETGMPVVYLNLVGGQDELVFDGGSFALNAAGHTTHRFPACEEGLFEVEYGRSEGRTVPTPGQLVEHLEEEPSVYGALVLGVRDYIEKNRFGGAVIGLSGGIDSALTLAIAVDAIGAERVEAVMMPSRFTSEMSLVDARVEAEALGVGYREISIEPVFQAFLAELSDAFAGRARDSTEENIQARCRGVILMALSNKLGRIVLTTGNKSEMSVGYATLYGDMAGGFAPIKDVPKLLVYRLSRYRNRLGFVIPERVLTRAPSAELAPDQKDEDSLPPYAVLDPILEGYIERDESIDDLIASGYDPDTVRRVAAMVDRNEYKRRQAPPGVRISRRAFGRDRRYPITSGYLAAQLKR